MKIRLIKMTPKLNNGILKTRNGNIENAENINEIKGHIDKTK